MLLVVALALREWAKADDKNCSFTYGLIKVYVVRKVSTDNVDEPVGQPKEHTSESRACLLIGQLAQQLFSLPCWNPGRPEKHVLLCWTSWVKFVGGID